MKQGWEIKKFEELIQENQIGLIKSTKEQGNDKPYRYLKMDSITSDNNLIHDRYVYVDADKSELEKYTLNEGDFLFNTRNSYELVGKTCVFTPIDDEPTLFNNNIMRVVFKKNISSRFINYAFSSELVKERLQKLKSGTTSVVGIYYNGLRNLEIPLPPLPEQQRIVSILDEAFAAIAKAKANAEQNLKNAKELFESYLQGVFEKKGDGWEEKTIGEIGNPKMCKRIFKEQTTTIGDIPFFKIGTFWKEPDAYISKEIYDEFRAKYSFPKKGDVLISASGTIGRRVRYDGEPAYFQDSNIVWIENDEKQVTNDFLYEFYGACNWGSTKGATISRLYNDNLKSIKISFPKSKEAQQTIVRQLDALRAETQKLEAVYQKKIDDLEELKKSILQKAFAGELRTPEGARYANDGHSPSDKKKSITSPEGA